MKKSWNNREQIVNKCWNNRSPTWTSAKFVFDPRIPPWTIHCDPTLLNQQSKPDKCINKLKWIIHIMIHICYARRSTSWITSESSKTWVGFESEFHEPCLKITLLLFTRRNNILSILCCKTLIFTTKYSNNTMIAKPRVFSIRMCIFAFLVFLLM